MDAQYFCVRFNENIILRLHSCSAPSCFSGAINGHPLVSDMCKKYQKMNYGKLHLKKIYRLLNYPSINYNIIRDDIPFLRDTSHSALNICGLKLRVMVAVSKHQLLL